MKKTLDDIETETNDGNSNETERDVVEIIASLEDDITTTLTNFEKEMEFVEKDITDELENAELFIMNVSDELRQLKDNFNRETEILKKKLQKVTVEVAVQTDEELVLSQPCEVANMENQAEQEELIETGTCPDNASNEMSQSLEYCNTYNMDSDLKNSGLHDLSSDNVKTYRPFCFRCMTSGHMKSECGISLTRY